MRKILCLYISSCLLLGFTSVSYAAGKPEIKSTKAYQQLAPQRAARAVFSGGKARVVGKWKDTQTVQICDGDAPSFDCFEGDATGTPVGGVACGLPTDDSRWYQGDEYCNTFAVNDMTVDAGTEGDLSTGLALAWFWHVTGAGSSEGCKIAIFTTEDFDDTCSGPPFDNAYDGILLDFGDLGSGDGLGYYYTTVCLADFALSLQNPVDGSGGYIIQLLTGPDGSETFATCGQPMFWGTGDGETPNDGRVGHQGPIEWDDDNPRDGAHTAPTECYDLAVGLCPDPLGAMLLLTGEGGPPPCNGDERLKAKCVLKNGNFLVSATVKNGTPGSILTFRLDGDTGTDQQKAVNSNGVAKAKFKRNIAAGAHTVEVIECGLSKGTNCQ